MRSFSRAALALLALASAAVHAAEQAPMDEPRVSVHRETTYSYAGVGLISANIEDDVVDQSPGGFHVRLGGMIDRHWGTELRLARGVWHEPQRIGPNTKLALDLDYLAGLYLTSRWDFGIPFIDVPLVDAMFLQAHAGIASLQLDIERETCNPGCSRTSKGSNDRTDMSWGVGIGLETRVPQNIYPNKIGLSLEYMDYGDKYDLPIDAIEAGIQFFF